MVINGGNGAKGAIFVFLASMQIASANAASAQESFRIGRPTSADKQAADSALRSYQSMGADDSNSIPAVVHKANAILNPPGSKVRCYHLIFDGSARM